MVVLLAVVTLAVVGAWRALQAKPKAGAIGALIAIDGDYAVLVHDVVSDPGRSFLRLVSVDRGERWGALIPAYDKEARGAGRVATEAGFARANTRRPSGKNTCILPGSLAISTMPVPNLLCSMRSPGSYESSLN